MLCIIENLILSHLIIGRQVATTFIILLNLCGDLIEFLFLVGAEKLIITLVKPLVRSIFLLLRHRYSSAEEATDKPYENFANHTFCLRNIQ